jgi:hypothetical protein
MGLDERLKRLEQVSGASSTHDLTRLTDEELLALRDCYDADGKVVFERITPELEAALLRVKR